MKINPITLSFKDETGSLEQPFRDFFCETSMKQIRTVIGVSFVLYAVFGFLDAQIFSEYSLSHAYVRYAIVCPLIFSVFLLSYSSKFCHFMQPLCCSFVVVAAGGIIFLAINAPRNLVFSYYAGIVLVLMVGYSLIRLRFVYATISGWTIIFLYEITTLVVAQESLIVLMSNNFFFITVNLIGMLSCYTIEHSARKDFYNTWILKQEENRIKNINTELQSTVEKRTVELQKALFKQEEIQDKVIETEKIAELGGLVAGIAHEINAPVSAGITATSFLDFRLKQFMENSKAILKTEVELEQFLEVVDEGITNTLKNLIKVSELIRMFRMVAVNHSGERKISIDLKNYLEEIIKGLNKGKNEANFSIRINCPEKLEIKNCPDNFALVVNNIVRNSFQHGFKGRDSGTFALSVETKNNDVIMNFSDDGNGMDDEAALRIFNPFFTTARPEGHTGLGMHIASSIVNRMFAGTIECKSRPGHGTTITIVFPLKPVSNTNAA